MKVLYAGDAASKIGPIFVASPFNFEVKGFSHHIWGQPLINSLNQGGIEGRSHDQRGGHLRLPADG